ncbi:putative intracellular protease/amidase [Streptomyces sp. LBL]|uniref:hypothetical protein n=1 Tax=Streptomyces sp. LBL TaxID=2940562 RepID=UPI0024771E2F|nr:hypothetical protein [Streptomyces sp. LBL]MDH6624571.1 putative intracellular protease/amidase [Streptomyces sp. LBL]
MRIAFLTTPEGVEQIELTDPWQAAKDAGHDPAPVSTEPGEIQAFHHLELVTSRKPDDLKAFCEAYLDVFAQEAA